MDTGEVDGLFMKLTALKNQQKHEGDANPCEMLEHLLLLMVRFRMYKEVVIEGLDLLKTLGPRSRIYKCIIVGLCRTGRYDECQTLLDQWKKYGPKDPVMLECKQKVEGFLLAVRSGVGPSHVFCNLEQALGLLGPEGFEMDKIVSRVTEVTPSASPSSSSVSNLSYSTQQFRATRSPMSAASSSSTHSVVAPRLMNPPYLAKLIKKVNSTAKITDILVDDLDGFKVKCFGELDVKFQANEHRWSFAIASKEALRTVSLLNNADRENFCITAGYFYYNQNVVVDLVKLHETNASRQLQVLNTFVPFDRLQKHGGWPTSFCYKIDVRFKSFKSGSFQQALVFDFKKDPKIVRHITAECIVESPQSLIDADHRSSNSNFSFDNMNASIMKEFDSPPTSCSPVSPQQELDTKAFERITEAVTPLRLARTLPKISLDKSNYISLMLNILNKEMQLLHSHFKKHQVVRSMKLTKSYTIEKTYNDEVKLAGPEERFLVMDFESSSFEGLIVGNLLNQYCKSVLVTNLNNFTQSYTCKVKEKLHNKWIIIMDFNQARELDLELDIPYQFKVEFVLDVFHFEEMKNILGKIGDVELQILFPDVARKIVSGRIDCFSDLLDDGVCTLNPTQSLANNVITKIPLDSAYIPPVLLIGPPGSGKTYTLTESVKQILMSQTNARILFCCYSDSSANKFINTIDELIKLGTKIRMIRVFDPEKMKLESVPNTIKQYCTFTLDYKLRLPHKIEIQQVNLVVCVIDTVNVLNKNDKMDLGKYYFSHIIIDEVGQVKEFEILSALLLANPNTRIVFSGDHLQFSCPFVGQGDMNVLGRLNSYYPDKHPCKILLVENYQCHAEILKFVSDHFFHVKLRCTSIQPTHPNYFPLSYFCVKGEETRNGSSFSNMAEVMEICKTIQKLVLTWPQQWGKYQEPSSILCLAAYEDQVARLKNQLRVMGLGFVSVDGIWNAKPSQYRVVILSTVRTFKGTSCDHFVETNDFFSNSKLIYSALIRAKSLFAVFGDILSLCTYGTCRNIWNDFGNIAAVNDSIFGINQIVNINANTSIQETQADQLLLNENRPTLMNQAAAATQMIQNMSNVSTKLDSFLPFNFELGTNIYKAPDENKLQKESQRLEADFWSNFNAKIEVPDEDLNFYSSFNEMNDSWNTQEFPRIEEPAEVPSTNNSQLNSIINKAFELHENEKKNISTISSSNSSLKNTKGNRANSGFTRENNNLCIIKPTPDSVEKDTLDDWIEVKKNKRPKPNNSNNASTTNSNTSSPGKKTVDEKIKDLIGMGFDKKKAIRALQQTNKDLNKAIDLLLSGQLNKSINLTSTSSGLNN